MRNFKYSVIKIYIIIWTSRKQIKTFKTCLCSSSLRHNIECVATSVCHSFEKGYYNSLALPLNDVNLSRSAQNVVLYQ